MEPNCEERQISLPFLIQKDLIHSYILLSIDSKTIKQALRFCCSAGSSQLCKPWFKESQQSEDLHWQHKPMVLISTKTHAERSDAEELTKDLQLPFPSLHTQTHISQWLTLPSSVIYLFVSTQLSIRLWFILPLAEEEETGGDIKWPRHPRNHL